MINTDIQLARMPILEEEIHLTLMELCLACSASEEHVMKWVFEGVLEPAGEAPPEWRFTGQSLRRARLALSFARDLDVNPPGIALALDLLDEIAKLQARLLRCSAR